jgi:RHS repeat-associated protein
MTVVTESITVGGAVYSVIGSITDELQNMVTYSYDSSDGSLISATWSDGSGSPERTITYHYSNGKLDHITDPRGIQKTINTYDEKGRVIQQSHEDGGTYLFDYVETGGLVTGAVVNSPSPYLQTIYGFDSTGYITSITEADDSNPMGFETSFERGPSGRILARTNALGEMTSYTYDTNGLVNSVTDAAGNMTRYLYEQYPDVRKPTKVVSPAPFSYETSMSYDAKGNLVSIIEPGFPNSVSITYSSEGLPTSITDQAGTSLYMDYHSNGQVNSITHETLGVLATYAYDPIGRVTSVRDAEGNTTRYDYYEQGRVVSVTDPLGGITSFEYDFNGNLTTFTDARGNSITYSYNSRDNVETITDQLLSGESINYTQIPNTPYIDRPYEKVDRNGKTTRYTYGNVDRYFRADYVDEGQYEEFFLDAVGRLATANSSNTGAVEFTYTDPTADKVVGMVKSVNSPQGIVSYTYDELGRRTSMNVDGELMVTYTYLPSGLVNSLTATNPVTGQPMTFNFTYDLVGRRTGINYPNGVTAAYSYDASGRLLSITHKDSSGATLESLSYTYDANGYRTSMERVGVDPVQPAFSNTLDYDPANRMQSLNSQVLTYDANGNLTHSESMTFTWDMQGRLIGITNSPAGNASFSYDALGRRAQKTIGGAMTKYLYDGLDIVKEMDELGNTKAWYVRTLNIDEPLARIAADGMVRYYHTDVLGSIIALTDANGVLRTQYNYSPFGVTQVIGEASDNPFQFTGRENDGTGLYYYRARYYSPMMGRFISEDPIGISGGINYYVESIEKSLLGMNLYTYANNNPVKYTDPQGEMSVIAGIIVGTAAAGSVVVYYACSTECMGTLGDISSAQKTDPFDEDWNKQFAFCLDICASPTTLWTFITDPAGSTFNTLIMEACEINNEND